MNNTINQTPALSDEHIAKIQHAVAQTKVRVFVLNMDGLDVVVKLEQPKRRQYGYIALRWLSWLLRQPVLKPSILQGGAQSQAVEVDRLEKLYASGVNVPKVLYVTDGWFAMTCVGSSSIDHKLRLGGAEALEYWKKGLEAILNVHKREQCLSQVFARNMMVHEQEVVFIDFEDDPVSVIGLTLAQTRDWLFYAFSSMWLLKITPLAAAEIMMSYVKRDNQNVQAALKKSCGLLAWLRFLPSKRQPWGRDVVAAQGAGAILYELQKLSSI